MSPELCEIHEALMSIGRRRAALDAEEMRWLRRALEVRIWQALGMVSPLDYLERKCGYAPRTAADRLRVAEALAHLPAIEGALARGEIPFSAVREIVRVAMPATERAWVAACNDKNLQVTLVLHGTVHPVERPRDPVRAAHVGGS